MQRYADCGVRVEVGEDCGRESIGDGGLHFCDSSVLMRDISYRVLQVLVLAANCRSSGQERGVEARSLIIPAPPLPLHTTEAREADFNLDDCIARAPATGTDALPFCGAAHCADDFCVAHFEVGGAICGCLGGDLGCEAAEFVPAAAVEAEEGESVG